MFTKQVMIGATSAIAFSVAAHAAPNLVVNGSFENAPAGNTLITANNLPGWSNAGNGLNLLFSLPTVDTSGSTDPTPGFGNILLWGPGVGSNNGLVASPDGGNFVGLDGGAFVQPLTQTISGLTVGNTYAVSFDWAGAQQYAFDGATTEQFQVGFGGSTQSTAVLNNVTHGFTGWQTQTFDYVATGTSQLLSFLAVGTPSGVPPFSLLDGVSVTDVTPTGTPEPATLVVLATGLVGVGLVSARHRAR